MTNTSNWKPSRKWTMRDAMKVSLPDILKMKKEERADLAQFFQASFMKRYREAQKAESIPYGVEKIQDDMEIFREKYGVSLTDRIVSGVKSHKFTKAWEKVPYASNVLGSYISMLQDFFTWKTNSVSGWEKLKVKESGELFGWKYVVRENGRRKRVPVYQMTDKERREFWRAYHELVKREGNNIVLSDPSRPTHYKGLKDAGFAKFWRELSQTGYEMNNSAELIEIMEASLNSGKLIFPEHSRAENGDNGVDPIFAGDELDTNDAFI